MPDDLPMGEEQLYAIGITELERSKLQAWSAKDRHSGY